MSQEELHHLVRVRRIRKGETVELLNGRGDVLTCSVEDISARDLQLKIENLARIGRTPLRRHLLVALPKGKTFPVLLQKAVELGVDEITPLLTANSEVGSSRAVGKLDRWEAVLTEAIKQSGNAWMPVLNQPVPLESAVAKGESGALRICAALQPDARPLMQVIRESCPDKGTVDVFVGPEGDFSPPEYAMLREAGCRFITLGPLVMKVETAASLVMGVIGVWAQDRCI